MSRDLWHVNPLPAVSPKRFVLVDGDEASEHRRQFSAGEVEVIAAAIEDSDVLLEFEEPYGRRPVQSHTVARRPEDELMSLLDSVARGRRDVALSFSEFGARGGELFDVKNVLHWSGFYSVQGCEFGRRAACISPAAARDEAILIAVEFARSRRQMPPE